MKLNIKKILTVSILCLMTLAVCAQEKLQTKKYRFSDFKERTTKIVLTGNIMQDALIKDGVTKSWNLSPYEFCDEQTFQTDMSDNSTYFLIFADSRFKSETDAGIMTIALYKGCEKASSEGIKGMDKVTSIPLCSAEDSDGREDIFLPLLLHNIQNNVEAIMKNDINIGSMVKVRSGKKDWQSTVYIDKNDLSVKLDPQQIEDYKANGVVICTDKEVQTAVSNALPGTLVGYSVSPSEPKSGNKYFNMVLCPETGEMYWMTSRKSKGEAKLGFSIQDLDAIKWHKN